MLEIVKSCIGTKFTSQFGDLVAISTLYSMGKIFKFQICLCSFIFILSCENSLHEAPTYLGLGKMDVHNLTLNK